MKRISFYAITDINELTADPHVGTYYNIPDPNNESRSLNIAMVTGNSKWRPNEKYTAYEITSGLIAVQAPTCREALDNISTNFDTYYKCLSSERIRRCIEYISTLPLLPPPDKKPKEEKAPALFSKCIYYKYMIGNTVQRSNGWKITLHSDDYGDRDFVFEKTKSGAWIVSDYLTGLQVFSEKTSREAILKDDYFQSELKRAYQLLYSDDPAVTSRFVPITALITRAFAGELTPEEVYDPSKKYSTKKEETNDAD